MNTLNILISALSSLNKTDIHEFEKFLRSPYFTRKHAYTKQSLQLLKDIKRLLPNKNKYPEIEKCFQKLFNYDNYYQKKKTNHIISNFHAYFQEFLSYENFKRNKPFQNLFLVQEMIERKMNEFLIHHKKARYFEIKNFDDNVTEAYYYSKLYSLMNKFKLVYGDIVDEGDYEIEIKLLNQFYHTQIIKILNRERISILRDNEEKELI